MISRVIPVLTAVVLFTACRRTESAGTVADTVEMPRVPYSEATTDEPATTTAAVDSVAPVVSCSPPVDREWYEPDPDQLMFLRSGMQWGSTEADVASRLGSPLRVIVDTTRNIHTGEPDELIQLQYEGLEFFVYRVLALARDIIYRVDADDKRYEFAFGFGVGSPWGLVRDCLGEPSGVADDSTYQYSVGEAEELITFWVTHGVVQRIRWDFYID